MENGWEDVCLKCIDIVLELKRSRKEMDVIWFFLYLVCGE